MMLSVSRVSELTLSSVPVVYMFICYYYNGDIHSIMLLINTVLSACRLMGPCNQSSCYTDAYA